MHRSPSMKVPILYESPSRSRRTTIPTGTLSSNLDRESMRRMVSYIWSSHADEKRPSKAAAMMSVSDFMRVHGFSDFNVSLSGKVKMEVIDFVTK